MYSMFFVVLSCVYLALYSQNACVCGCLCVCVCVCVYAHGIVPWDKILLFKNTLIIIILLLLFSLGVAELLQILPVSVIA